jgi:hypothetical protein
VELNTIADFLRDAHAGVLSSGATARNGRLSATFVRQALDASILDNPPVMAGGDQSSEPILRVMHALGSSRNRADFILLLSRLNNVKSRVCGPGQYRSDERILIILSRSGVQMSRPLAGRQ